MFGLFELGVAGGSIGFDESGLTGGIGGVVGSLWAVAAPFGFVFCLDGASGGGPNGLMASGMWMFAVPPGAGFDGALPFGAIGERLEGRGRHRGRRTPPRAPQAQGAHGGAGAMKR